MSSPGGAEGGASESPRLSYPGDEAMRDLSAADRTRHFLAAFEAQDPVSGGYDAVLMAQHVHFLSATAEPPTPRVLFGLTVAPELCNRLGNLHGGAVATIFDMITTCAIPALVTKAGWWEFPGVSRTLNVTYLRAMPEGAELEVSAEVLAVGKRLCTLRGEMRRKADGALMAVCEHGKVNVDADLAKL
ncbi:MAG: hypothetical protein M1832_004016 [Thelocarpon impressellum]|nr:MAG: hypothetical protein M1832_004016 [Thelocarpon impressellum]